MRQFCQILLPRSAADNRAAQEFRSKLDFDALLGSRISQKILSSILTTGKAHFTSSGVGEIVGPHAASPPAGGHPGIPGSSAVEARRCTRFSPTKTDDIFREEVTKTMIVRRMSPSEVGWYRGYSPFDEIRRQMQSLMGEMEAAFPGRAGAGVFPAVNVTQDEDNLYVRAELPGMKASELQVTAIKNRLVLSGTRQIDPEDERVSYHRRERTGGYFNRSLVLPVDFQSDRVAAQYVDGILSVTLPRTPEAKPRQIQVKSA